MTISSVVAMLAFADLGIGNGLLNVISSAYGSDDVDAIREHISSAMIILSLISVMIFAAFWIANAYIDWPKVFNVHSPQAVQEAGPAVVAFMICFVLNIPAAIVQRVQLGLQLGFLANVWQAAGSVFSLVAVLISVKLRVSLPTLVFALAGMPLVAAFMNGVAFFFKFRRDLMPRISEATKSSAASIARTGVLFFIMQAVSSFTYSSDNVIIAHALGAAAVTVNAVPEKLFSFISVMIFMFLSPLWPAYGEAIARGDIPWVRKTLARSVRATLPISLLLSSFFLIFGRAIISRWIGHSVPIPFLLMLGMALWKIVEATSNAYSMLFNGANIVGFQIRIGVTSAITSVILKLVLIQYIGVSGPIFATLICCTIFAFVPSVAMGRRLLAEKSPKGGF